MYVLHGVRDVCGKTHTANDLEELSDNPSQVPSSSQFRLRISGQKDPAFPFVQTRTGDSGARANQAIEPPARASTVPQCRQVSDVSGFRTKRFDGEIEERVGFSCVPDPNHSFLRIAVGPAFCRTSVAGWSSRGGHCLRRHQRSREAGPRLPARATWDPRP